MCRSRFLDSGSRRSKRFTKLLNSMSRQSFRKSSWNGNSRHSYICQWIRWIFFEWETRFIINWRYFSPGYHVLFHLFFPNLLCFQPPFLFPPLGLVSDPPHMKTVEFNFIYEGESRLYSWKLSWENGIKCPWKTYYGFKSHRSSLP